MGDPWGHGSFHSNATGTTATSSPPSSLPSAPRQRFNSFQASSINDSKSLINNGAQDDDDETGELLKDPIRYAESNLSLQSAGRRATNPSIPPIQQRMAGLSLNTSQAASPAVNGYPTPSSAMQPPNSAMSPTMMSSVGASAQYPLGGNNNSSNSNNSSATNGGTGSQFQRSNFPAVNPADQNPPCNTLYVGNLPIDTSEDELKAMFSKQRGYKRLCFRTKQNGPMCFVEFEDVSFATKALHELYGHPLHNSIKGGIRLSFSKNPLGVRSGQGPGVTGPPAPTGSGGMPGANSMMSGMTPSSFSSANGPPPGLSAPPGLGPSRVQYGAVMNPMVNANGQYGGGAFAGNGGWNTPNYSTASPAAMNMGMPSQYNHPMMNGGSASMNGAASPKYASPTMNGLPTSMSGAGSPTYGNAMPNGRLNGNSGFPPYMMGR